MTGRLYIEATLTPSIHSHSCKKVSYNRHLPTNFRPGTRQRGYPKSRKGGIAREFLYYMKRTGKGGKQRAIPPSPSATLSFSHARLQKIPIHKSLPVWGTINPTQQNLQEAGEQEQEQEKNLQEQIKNPHSRAAIL